MTFAGFPPNNGVWFHVFVIIAPAATIAPLTNRNTGTNNGIGTNPHIITNYNISLCYSNTGFIRI